MEKLWEATKTSDINFVKPSACNKSCKVIIEILSLLLWEKLQTTPLGFINNNWKKTRIINKIKVEKTKKNIIRKNEGLYETSAFWF